MDLASGSFRAFRIFRFTRLHPSSLSGPPDVVETSVLGPRGSLAAAVVSLSTGFVGVFNGGVGPAWDTTPAHVAGGDVVFAAAAAAAVLGGAIFGQSFARWPCW